MVACLVPSRAGHSDEIIVSAEMMRNDGAEEASCFRCPMIAVFLSFLFPSPCSISSALFGRAACLPVPCRGRDELRGLRVALFSRLIASGSSGILFLVPCDWFLSAFLCLARCYCTSGFIPSLYRSRPPTPSSFLLGYQGRGRFFLSNSPCLLTPSTVLSPCPSADCFVLCGYPNSISQSRPVFRPVCSTRRAGRLWL